MARTERSGAQVEGREATASRAAGPRAAAFRAAERGAVRFGVLGALSAGAVATLTMLAASSCSSGELTDGPSTECDVPTVLAEKCGGRVCHGNEEPAAGLDLVSAGVEDRIVGVRGSVDCDEEVLIEPGYPNNSLLIEKVSQEAPSCGRPMPPTGAPPLTSFEIECLREFARSAEGGPSCETCGGILCVDLNSSTDHCGACDAPCDDGLLCAQGTCIDACDAGTTLCDTSCVDLDTDEDHCGACGKRCGAGSTCQGGACVCDDDAVASFSADVAPILKASCGGSDCHTGDSGVSSLQLGEDVAYEQLVEVASDGCEGATRVVPGDPGSSYLVEKLVGGTMCNGKRMPLFATLPEEAIAKVVGWICAGAPND